MIIDTKCKKCRRAGEKLFLKGEKCFTPKCTFEKKPNTPGLPISARKHRSMLSEYGMQLKEKQKVRNVYRLSEKQFSAYVMDASKSKGDISPVEKLYENLEMRLDNVVYRLGFAGVSRGQARQLTSHGHVTVNNRRVDIPSYKVKVSDVISLREGSRKKVVFENLKDTLEKYTCPSWLSLNTKKLEGTVQGLPKFDKVDSTFNFTAIMEFYSR